MRMIISPAKKMVVRTDDIPCEGLPTFVDEAELLRQYVCGLTYEEQRKLWACSDALARKSADLFAHMDLHGNLTPALLAYDGIQYTYMAPTVFETGQIAYVQEHLRILSGFYGVLKPLDGVVPHRLEMQAKASVGTTTNLYEFWGDRLYREVMGNNQDRTVLNLASKEYSRAVERHLRPGDRFVTCVFGEPAGTRIVQKGVYAKMARGEMVRYLASMGATAPEQTRDFAWSGYAFDEARSTDTSYVFVRRATSS